MYVLLHDDAIISESRRANLGTPDNLFRSLFLVGLLVVFSRKNIRPKRTVCLFCRAKYDFICCGEALAAFTLLINHGLDDLLTSPRMIDTVYIPALSPILESIAR